MLDPLEISTARHEAELLKKNRRSVFGILYLRWFQLYNSHHRLARLDWAVMGLSFLLAVTPIASKISPERLPLSDDIRLAMLAGSSLGIGTKGWRHKRRILTQQHHHRISEEIEAEMIATTSKTNPYKMVEESSEFADSEQKRIMKCLNMSGKTRFISCGGGDSKGQYIRYYFRRTADSTYLSEPVEPRSIEDIKRTLRTTEGVSFLDTVPGMPYCAIDIGLNEKDPRWRPFLLSEHTLQDRGRLLLQLGVDGNGRPQSIDVEEEEMGSMIIAASPGAGKSTLLRSMAKGIASSCTEETAKMVFIDLKVSQVGVSSGTFPEDFGRLPHAAAPIITDQANALIMLDGMARYMQWRQGVINSVQKRNSSENCSSLKEYNASVSGDQRMPHLFIFVDEAGVFPADGLFGSIITQIAKLGRSAGVHVIAAWQRPSKYEVNIEYRNTCTHRVCMKVGEPSAAALVLGLESVEHPFAVACKELQGKGDMFYETKQGPARIQGYKDDINILDHYMCSMGCLGLDDGQKIRWFVNPLDGEKHLIYRGLNSIISSDDYKVTGVDKSRFGKFSDWVPPRSINPQPDINDVGRVADSHSQMEEEDEAEENGITQEELDLVRFRQLAELHQQYFDHMNALDLEDNKRTLNGFMNSMGWKGRDLLVAPESKRSLLIEAIQTCSKEHLIKWIIEAKTQGEDSFDPESIKNYMLELFGTNYTKLKDYEELRQWIVSMAAVADKRYEDLVSQQAHQVITPPEHEGEDDS